MFWKFWFPALMFIGVYLMGKIHARRNLPTEPFNITPQHEAVRRFQRVSRDSLRTTSLTLLFIAVVWIGWFIYHDWQEAHQVVDVRVVHVQTMHTTVYQAQRNKIQGRSFDTLDGRRITLADVERMEISEKP
ncbi:MAG: hypothetical protein HQM01_00800 [Magnetococcales bacterium]|nr:hypothetical protein [Magnetococcales bacterium]